MSEEKTPPQTTNETAEPKNIKLAEEQNKMLNSFIQLPLRSANTLRIRTDNEQIPALIERKVEFYDTVQYHKY